MKLRKSHFNLFKKYCRSWIDTFCIKNWDIDYDFGAIADSEAVVSKNYMGCRVNVKLADEIELSNNKTIEYTLNEVAKHEMLHILIGNLVMLAGSRFITRDELSKSEEELIIKLCKIIK